MIMKMGINKWGTLFIIIGVSAMIYLSSQNTLLSIAGIPDVECPMTTSNICEAELVSQKGVEHILVTVDNYPPHRAISDDSNVNNCQVTVHWDLPAGMWGDAVGSGAYDVDGEYIFSGTGTCRVNTNRMITVRSTTDGKYYDFPISQLEPIINEVVMFYYEDPPECITGSDCPQDSCSGYECIDGECIPAASATMPPCDEAVWIGYSTCSWDESECGFKISDYLPFIVILVSIMLIASLLIFARKRGLF